MEQFPSNIAFKFPWRKYQKELLDQLDFHFQNDHFHIVAPPGSGKTVLGLEVMIRLNKPTVIFAPTISIKNQWIDRFCGLFLNTDEVPYWISTDIKNPNFLTVVTYQALHAATKTEEDVKNVVKNLKKQKVNCLVFDEAHHLKKEWWKSLFKIKENLGSKIIALTATPPYDVDFAEWTNYLELNGDIDAEIYVPDLISEKNLCPHQDFIHYSFPSVDEYNAIEKQKDKAENIFNEIAKEPVLISELQKLPFFVEPEKNENLIFENIGFYSSVLIFLKHHGCKISKEHREIIGNEEINIPEFDENWAETLLTYFLLEDQKYFQHLAEFKENLLNKLIRNGVVENNRINFSKNENVNSKLINSISKLNSILEIVDFEYQNLGSELRMVILTDYIRKEYFTTTLENDIELKRIGVLSIFEKLRRTNSQKKKIAVLTGSIVVLPIHCREEFLKKVDCKKIPLPNLFNLSYDEAYFQFQQNEILNNQIVAIVTELFNEGKIEIIIGTKSLLGEGWDAPCINSLVLASFVGSFVLSNQMRGRAIRTESGNPEKTSNIWHLVCLNPIDENFGEDFLVMKRRFRSFVGIGYSPSPVVQNSFSRVKSDMNIYNFNDVQKTNLATFALASERNQLEEKWRTAINKGTDLVEEIKIPFSKREEFKRTKKMYYSKTTKGVLLTLISGVLGFGGQTIASVLKGLRNISSLRELGIILSTFGIAGLLIFGGYTIKTLKILWRYKNISKDFQQIGYTLLKSLQFEGSIKNSAEIIVETREEEVGVIVSNLKNASNHENKIFLNSLNQIVSPIENPRYLIAREDKFLFFLLKKDYHAIPEILGRNKKTAAFFTQQWNANVGNAKLFFTQNAEGRKMLIKARFNSYASNFQKKSEIINEWK